MNLVIPFFGMIEIDTDDLCYETISTTNLWHKFQYETWFKWAMEKGSLVVVRYMSGMKNYPLMRGSRH